MSLRSLKLYVADFSIVLFAVPFLLFYPKASGMFAGWLAAIFWSLYQWPQVYKIHKAKSVQGFSFMLVSLIGLGNLIDFFIAYSLNWPVQSMVIALRGVCIYLIFCFQFWKYAWRNSE